MTFTGVAPGQSSLRALEWLARVGASPSLPLQLVMGCSERVARDHVSRLKPLGLHQRTRMRRGDGALVMVTRIGALEAGHPARRAMQRGRKPMRDARFTRSLTHFGYTSTVPYAPDRKHPSRVAVST